MALEIVEYDPLLQSEDVGEEICTSFPLGGPIFVPGIVSPLTSTPEFETSVVHELRGLEEELFTESIEICEDDICVDDLRVFSEEELVDKAFKEAFKDDEEESRLEYLENHDMELSCTRDSNSDGGGECSSQGSSGISKSSERRLVVCRNKKRGRIFDRESRAAMLEGEYLTRVEQLVNIKQHQDKDRAEATLHCLEITKDPVDEALEDEAERLKALRFMASAPKVKPEDLDLQIPICFPETVLFVEVYHRLNKQQKVQEFMVLGCQKLTELRDKICCLTDQVMQDESYDPSGYFLIEGLFCDDLRDPNAIRYSEPILDWLRDSKDEVLAKWELITSECSFSTHKALLSDMPSPRVPVFKSVLMQNVRFCDLKFQLGSGYLYCHQGDCKHVLVIRDMRLLHPEDVQNRAAYPLLIFQLRNVHKRCSICEITRAKKVTYDDKYAPENPSYFCENCYYLLHYSGDGTLLYDGFNVYDYHPD